MGFSLMDLEAYAHSAKAGQLGRFVLWRDVPVEKLDRTS